jgi:hypothetical protein
MAVEKKTEKTGFENRTEAKKYVVETIKSLLETTTEEEFFKLGYERVDKSAGVYGNEKTLGAGVDDGKFSIKVHGTTHAFVTKQVFLGAKRVEGIINLSYITDNIIGLEYKITEQSIRGGHIVNETVSLKIDSKKQFEKDLKTLFKEIAKKEISYLTKTKIGVEDDFEMGKTQIKENSIMKKLTLKGMISKNILEGKNKFKPLPSDEEENIDKVKDLNTIDIEDKKGKTGKKIFLDAKERTKEIEEVTSAGGGGVAGMPMGTAGNFAFQSPKFAKNVNPDFFATPYSKKNSKRPKVDSDYKVKPSKKDKYYTEVPLIPGSGYVPVGMNKNYAQGQHSLNENTEKSTSFDLNRKKIFNLNENEQKGVNKRYLITEKTTKEYQEERWKKLTSFKLYESIKDIEENNDHEEVVHFPEYPTGAFDAKDEIDFFAKMDYDNDVKSEDSVDSEEFVFVEKPDSKFKTEHKFYKKDFLNENKKFILDLNTMVFVKNPNSK